MIDMSTKNYAGAGSPAIMPTSRFTDADTRRSKPVAVHASRLKYSAASGTTTTSWARMATAQAALARIGRTRADTSSRTPWITTGGRRLR